MSTKLHHSAGHKTYAVAIGDVQHTTTIRRLPLRNMDNDTRYRVRIIRTDLATGAVLSNGKRDLNIFAATAVYEQNVARLARLAGE